MNHSKQYDLVENFIEKLMQAGLSLRSTSGDVGNALIDLSSSLKHDYMSKRITDEIIDIRGKNNVALAINHMRESIGLTPIDFSVRNVVLNEYSTDSSGEVAAIIDHLGKDPNAALSHCVQFLDPENQHIKYIADFEIVLETNEIFFNITVTTQWVDGSNRLTLHKRKCQYFSSRYGHGSTNPLETYLNYADKYINSSVNLDPTVITCLFKSYCNHYSLTPIVADPNWLTKCLDKVSILGKPFPEVQALIDRLTEEQKSRLYKTVKHDCSIQMKSSYNDGWNPIVKIILTQWFIYAGDFNFSVQIQRPYIQNGPEKPYSLSFRAHRYLIDCSYSIGDKSLEEIDRLHPFIKELVFEYLDVAIANFKPIAIAEMTDYIKSQIL